MNYQIIVKGRIDEHWRRWLNGMVAAFQTEPNQTTISVHVPDQAALRGILEKLWDLNMTVIAVNQETTEV